MDGTNPFTDAAQQDYPLPPYDDPCPSTQPASARSKRIHSLTSKAGWPLNKVANWVGAEAWWPSSMAKECNKAARILHSFTTLNTPRAPGDAPVHPVGITTKSPVVIPDAILRNCAGLAIFNTLRAGAIHGSLAGGSGLVVARRGDGTWSPPSSFVVSTLGGGFMIGLDIYECVFVLSTRDQVRAFARSRISLGAEASVALGPLGGGACVDAALSGSDSAARPIWSYMKSRGLWAGVQVDGTVFLARPDANAVFYNEKGISPQKILLSANAKWPAAGGGLLDVLETLDGRLAGLDLWDPDLPPLVLPTVIDDEGEVVEPDTTVRERSPPPVYQRGNYPRRDDDDDDKQRFRRTGLLVDFEDFEQ